jgi:LacI family repressor for deo operon, udp, cdd, tsx, nupC, and nupG
MSSHREIAKLAGVSVATVSRALFKPEKVSPETIKKVKDAIATMGYRPNMMAKSFRHSRSNAVVVLVPEIANTFYASFIKGVGDIANQHNYSILISDTRGKPEREKIYIDRVYSRMADGVIQLRPYNNKEKVAFTPDIPWVNACGCEFSNGPTVRIDNREAAKHVIDYLASLGHRQIGVISGPQGDPHSLIRLEGYKEGLNAANISFDEGLLAQGDYTMWSGQNAAKKFCAMPVKPTAIFCMNDEMAIGAIQTLKANGINVPEDISVTGFDNIIYAKYSDPPLTTISQPTKSMGEVAMKMLLEIIEGNTPVDQDCILPFEFIIRKSTTTPRRESIATNPY